MMSYDSENALTPLDPPSSSSTVRGEPLLASSGGGHEYQEFSHDYFGYHKSVDRKKRLIPLGAVGVLTVFVVMLVHHKSPLSSSYRRQHHQTPSYELFDDDLVHEHLHPQFHTAPYSHLILDDKEDDGFQIVNADFRLSQQKPIHFELEYESQTAVSGRLPRVLIRWSNVGRAYHEWIESRMEESIEHRPIRVAGSFDGVALTNRDISAQIETETVYVLFPEHDATWEIECTHWKAPDCMDAIMNHIIEVGSDEFQEEVNKVKPHD